MGTANNPLRDCALYLAGLGWHVFPLRPGTKRPTGHRETDCPGTGRCAGRHQTPEMRATIDPDVIRAAWQATPFGIGIATGPSGLVVVDLDIPKDGDTGPDGATALEALAAERGGPIPGTWTVTTPSGGRHLYYTSPPGVRLRSTAKHVCANVDTRAWGGYVVGPGTVLPDGGYGVLDDTDPAELPAWLVQAILERPATTTSTTPAPAAPARRDAWATAAIEGEADRVRAAVPGQHNPVLASAAYTLGRKIGAGLIEHHTARAALITAGNTLIGHGEHWPPDAAEVERVVDAGLAKGATNPSHTTGPGEVAA